MIGLISAWDSSLVFFVCSEFRTLGIWSSFGFFPSELGSTISLGSKPGGISFLIIGSFSPDGTVSFGGNFSLSERSSDFSFSFSLLDSLLFSSLGPTLKHYLCQSILSKLGSYPKTMILSFGICLSLIRVMVSSNTLVSSKKESSGCTS